MPTTSTKQTDSGPEAALEKLGESLLSKVVLRLAHVQRSTWPEQ